VIEDILDNPINEVKVFSQNGTLLFSERNYKNTWKGTYNGKAIPPGTYYYEINVYNGESIIKGFLTIIRSKNN
jgi:gliding motility-associated-like protein